MVPYSEYSREELTTRDLLAMDRTILANERTLLAYVRTALGLLALGITFLHFFAPGAYHTAGYALIVLGALVLAGGVCRFVQIKRQLDRARRHPAGEPAGEPPPE